MQLQRLTICRSQKLESTMAANQGENYSEANLLDLLFNQGPANFRVLRSWIGLIKNKN